MAGYERQQALVIPFKKDPDAGFPISIDGPFGGDFIGDIQIDIHFGGPIAGYGHIGVDVFGNIGPGAHSGVPLIIGGHVKIIKAQILAEVVNQTATAIACKRADGCGQLHRLQR